MRSKPKFNNMPRGHRDFETNGDPVVKNATSVAVFHGDPNPKDCVDDWCRENWR